MTWRDDLTRLLDAIERAEGGRDALLRAVRCSLPSCADYAEARRIAENTVLHRLWDFAMLSDNRNPFIAFLGERWAPVGADNDPYHLNENWVKNVTAAFEGGA